MNEKGYQKLNVFWEAHYLTKMIYEETKKFPREELFGLTSQIRRAAVSVVANIVEGHAKRSKKEFLQALNIANGSLVETEYYLELCLELGYIKERERYELIEAQRRKVGVYLNKLMSSLTH